MSTAADQIAGLLRQHQEQHPQAGAFFIALHKFIDRTLERFFLRDFQDMPKPLVAVEPIPGNRRGEYRPQDGFLLPHKIIIDPYKMDTGLDAPEVLAHEMVHLWEWYLGYPMQDGIHAEPFHNKMADYGIVSKGDDGHHIGLMGEVWVDWLEENSDLNLATFMFGELPNPNPLHVYRCPQCRFSFLTHSTDAKVTCECTDDCFHEMEMRG